MMDSLFARITKAFRSKPHGDKLRYRAGCRCLLCRAANATYESDRYRARKNGDWNGLVDAGPARRHIRKMARRGVGEKSFERHGVVPSLRRLIMLGKRKRIRARTEKAVLAVDSTMCSDGCLVDAGPTLRIIDGLLDRGYDAAQLAEWLGRKNLRLGRRGKVVWRNAERVKKLAEDLNAGRLARGATA
jgi:hypothetical protein